MHTVNHLPPKFCEKNDNKLLTLKVVPVHVGMYCGSWVHCNFLTILMTLSVFPLPNECKVLILLSVTPHGIHTVSLSNDTYLKALVDHSLAWTCKRVFTFFRFPVFNLIFFIIFLNFFLDRIQDLCIIFAIIVVFLVFFNTYIFQAGLVSLLIRKFKTTIIISILYLALSVGLHVWTMVSVP